MSVIDLIVAAFVYYLPAYAVNGGMFFVGSMVEGGFPSFDQVDRSPKNI